MTSIGTYLGDRLKLELGAAKQNVVRDNRFALDPLAHLEAGHVQIMDVETLLPVVFTPWSHEIELIESWPDLERLRATGELRFNNVHGEKSRQMGWTWTLAYVLLWAINYWPIRALALHLKLAKIDDGGSASSVESLFGKIRFMASHGDWPNGLKPIDTLAFRQQPDHLLMNRLNGAYILGEGATPEPGRGGTYHAVLADEAARLAWQRQVQAAIVSACPVGRMYASTPQGEDNVYAEIRRERPAGFRFLRHHWSIHPVYSRGLHIAGSEPESCSLCAGNALELTWEPTNPLAHRYPGKLTSPWYDRVILELTDEQVAQELDIDYTLSLPARVYTEFSEDVHVLPHIAFEPTLGIELSWDYGWTHATAVGIWQDGVDCLRKIGEYEVTDHRPDEIAAGLRQTFLNIGMPENYTSPSISSQLFAVGDPAGEGTELATGRSLTSDYRRLGFNIISKRASVGETITAYKRLLMGQPKPIRYSGDTCPKTIAHLKSNRWPTDRQGVRKLGATKPLDDIHNHMGRADAYYINWKYPPPEIEETLNEASYGWVEGKSPYLRVEDYEVDPRSGLIDGGMSTDMSL